MKSWIGSGVNRKRKSRCGQVEYPLHYAPVVQSRRPFLADAEDKTEIAKTQDAVERAIGLALVR